MDTISRRIFYGFAEYGDFYYTPDFLNSANFREVIQVDNEGIAPHRIPQTVRHISDYNVTFVWTRVRYEKDEITDVTLAGKEADVGEVEKIIKDLEQRHNQAKARREAAAKQ